MQLGEWQDRFAKLGVNVAGMTYDSQEILADFADTATLSFPLLHDENSEHMNAFGIRDVDYEPDSRFYGIPYPGMVLISPQGEVLEKFAVPGYRARPEFAEVYAEVSQRVGSRPDTDTDKKVDDADLAGE